MGSPTTDLFASPNGDLTAQDQPELNRPVEGHDLDVEDGQPHHYRALIVDGDPATVVALKLALQTAGLDTAGAGDGYEAIRKCARTAPQIILLESGASNDGGWETLRWLRQLTDAPVLMMSSSKSLDERVAGLKQGADDFLAKPLYLPEVVARVRAALRRARISEASAKQVFLTQQLVINFVTQEVVLRGQPVDLPPLQFATLAVLAKYAPTPVAYQALAEAVWGRDGAQIRQRLRWTIFALRQRLEQDASQPRLILNRTGYGYQLHLNT
jgi:two-component system KDP operon response regulator KdpE